MFLLVPIKCTQVVNVQRLVFFFNGLFIVQKILKNSYSFLSYYRWKIYTQFYKSICLNILFL